MAPLVLVIGMAAAVCAAFALQNSSQHKVLFEKAKFTMETKGDLKGAIDLFEEIIKKYPNERDYAAKSQLYIGMCYEKLGQEQASQAQKAFEKVVKNFPEQAEVVKVANEKLFVIQKSRTIAETGDQGFNMRKVWDGGKASLQSAEALSPDGRYISFVDWNTGDLATYEIATGKIRYLTNKGSWDKSNEFAQEHTWSPDSREISYVWYIGDKAVEIRIIGLNGAKPRTLYSPGEGGWTEVCDWSPDGKEILAYAGEKDKKPQLVAISVADGSLRPLEIRGNRWPGNPRFSPDGRYIVYHSEQAEKTTDRDIFLLKSDGTEDFPLVEHSADDYAIGWTPDGKGVLFGSDRTGTFDLWFLPVAEGRVLGNPQFVRSNIGRVNGLRITEQGSYYYIIPRRNLFDIYTAKLDNPSADAPMPPQKLHTRFEGTNVCPQYSPDGKYLVYISETRTTWRSAPVICLQSLETGKVREIPTDLASAGWPRWSPDGRYLLLGARTEKEKNGDGSLYRLDTRDGSVKVLVRNDLENTNIVNQWSRIKGEWSPDGKGLFYVLTDRPANTSTLLYRDLQSGADTELYRTSLDAHISMSVSPDGRRIALLILKDGERSLRLMPAAGGKMTELCSFEDKSNLFPSMVWAPDGKYIYLERRLGGEGCSVWRVSTAGRDLQKLHLEMPYLSGLSIHPDGTQIAFFTLTMAGKSDEIWVMENFLPKAAGNK